jgi:hypothetical protein
LSELSLQHQQLLLIDLLLLLLRVTLLLRLSQQSVALRVRNVEHLSLLPSNRIPLLNPHLLVMFLLLLSQDLIGKTLLLIT